MGTMVVSKGTVAGWKSKVIPPVTRGLEAWFTFDTDASRFYYNRAPGRPDARIVGSPVAFPTHGRFTSLVDYLQTEVVDTANVTIIAVCRSPVALPEPLPTPDPRPVYASTFSGPSITPGITGTSFGVTLSNSGAALLNATAARSNGSGGVTTGQINVADNPTEWGIRVLRTSSAEGTMIENLTRGSKAIGTALTQRALTANKFRIGSSISSFTGVSDISALSIHSEALTDAEIAALASLMRGRMQRLGISV